MVKAQRDGLKLLAVMIPHTDTKPEQQRLLCLPGGMVKGNLECTKPFLMLHDVGLTLGRANRFNSNFTGSVNFDSGRKHRSGGTRHFCEGHSSCS